MVRRGLFFVSFMVFISTSAAAQPYAPIVAMNVTTQNGRTHELTAPESGVTSIKLEDGTEYSFRPTIQDSSPWNQIVVTIFRAATEKEPTTTLGEVEVRRGGLAVESKTKPAFKVSVPKVSPPAGANQ